MANANESAIKWPNVDFSEKDVKEIDGNDDRVEKGTIKQILVFAVTMLYHNKNCWKYSWLLFKYFEMMRDCIYT